MPRPDGLQLGALLRPGDVDFPTIERAVRTLEVAGFHAVVVAADDAGFEPFTLLSALSSVTERIGLVASVGAVDDEPYAVARKLASLDHVSGGRAGWDVAGFDDASGRTRELVEVVEGLWDATADDAMIRDKASGIYFRQEARRPLDHVGEHFRVAGPLNIARPPQGHPVLVAAGSAAARFGDVLVADLRTRADRAAADARLAALGRDPTDVRIWAASGAEGIGVIADRYETGVIDGVLVPFSALSEEVDRFVGDVLPLLRERGAVRPPDHGSLRDQLGLPRPAAAVPA